MTMDPTDPSRLYLGEYTEGSLALTRSVDGGANWNYIFRLNTDAADGTYAMAIDPTSSDILYLGLEDYNEGGVRKSVDGGATWVGSGLTGSAVTVMTIDPAGSTIYASTEGVHSQPAGFRGLFKSTDGGASWAELSQGLEALRNARIRVTAILTGPPNSHSLYVGTAGAGVFRSTDGGATWNPFNDGLGNLNVRVLAMSRTGQGVLYAGTAGGVYTVSLSIP
jgi:BNR/Asp-box repeat